MSYKKIKKILTEFHLKIEQVHDPYITRISSGYTDMLIENYAHQIHKEVRGNGNIVSEMSL